MIQVLNPSPYGCDTTDRVDFRCADEDHLSALDILEDIDHPMNHQELHETLRDDPDYLFSLL